MANPKVKEILDKLFPWEKIEQIPKMQKLGAVLGVYLLITVALWFFFIKPYSAYIVTLEEQIEEAENKLRVLNSAKKKKEIREAPVKLEELRYELGITKNFLPDQDQVDQLLKDISAKARESGLNVVEFDPQPRGKEDLKDGFLARVPFSMGVEGPYIRVASFIYKLSRLPRIVHIESLRISNPQFLEGELILRTSLSGTTFRFVETSLPVDVLTTAQGAEKK